MRGADAVKERLDIVDVASGYLKLEKAGQNYKGRCPFHTEKTASFFVSVARQRYYCFGCGAKGDIFTLVSELEGLDFKDSLRLLADRAGVTLEHENKESSSEKDQLYRILDDASLYFESELAKFPEARVYLESRGVTPETQKNFRVGYAQDEWRALSTHLASLGYSKDLMHKAGLIKYPDGGESERTPYDVFRGRVVFPLMDANGRIIAFSGRALQKDALAKYLNSPDTTLFRKSEVLFGLDKAKDDIRKKNFAVLVEGQMDLVLSHQAGIKNTVASSGTAFTADHLLRLKRLSARIILAFDGDEAGEKAAEKSAALGLGLGMEVKIATLPTGKDPADMIVSDADAWKDVLRQATHAIESVLRKGLASELDPRKAGKFIQARVLPLILLLESSIERSHFISVVSKLSGIREDVLWEDLRSAKRPETQNVVSSNETVERPAQLSRRDRITERITELEEWKKEATETSIEHASIHKEAEELEAALRLILLEEERTALRTKLNVDGETEEIVMRIDTLSRLIDEEKRKVV